MKFSVLQRSRPTHVETVPYSHFVADDPLPVDLYQRLSDTFPLVERFIAGLSRVTSNQAVRIPASSVVDNPRFAPEWREFFRYHTSQAFWDEIVQVFGPAIDRTYPDLGRRAGMPIRQWRAKRRGSPGDAEVELDALFVINTPVERMSSVRPAHVDNEDKIFAGNFYMRPENDPTPGGDLALYSFKPGHKGFGGHYAPMAAIVEEKVIGYRANRFVALVNSPDSIHGVTPRPPTEWPRRYVNIVAVTPFKLFALPQIGPLKQLSFWLELRRIRVRGVMATADR